MRFNVALAQMHIERSVNKNRGRISEFTSEANRKDADIVVLPETCLDWFGSLKNADVGHRFRDFFTKLAMENSVDIVTGSMLERDSKNRYYNISYYVDRRGRVLTKYRKRNLWLSERRRITPGNKSAVAKTDYGRIGILICWDIMREEFFKELVRQGAEVVLCPSYWWNDIGTQRSNVRNLESLLVARSFENELVIGYCNAAGINGKTELLGRSQICTPFDRHVMSHNREGLLIEEVDTGEIARAERMFKLREDILIHR